ncbi:YihY family inner membrane protein [Ruficoccus amylovorans]|uniref:YihY family inner membrane protein n=1 Tax=Ruficoccus amylovorans TaxID=1804625 RepID=A0A842HCS9_9BACT|nr:YihY/virulence factor BrkB family protein [Ruficoccus amylovorans]MBC2594273.1 YihY family inner membrane protein [Ruficoccus amylovorans]
MPSNEAKKPSRIVQAFTRVKNWLVSVPHLIGKEIWETDKVDDKSLRGSGFAVLRVLAITWEGILRNLIPSQAGALSYYTLIAIGPLLAIVIMVSGFVLKGDNAEDIIVENLTKLIYFVAPPTEQAAMMDLNAYDADHNNVPDTQEGEVTVQTEDGDREKASVDPKIVEFLKGIVRNARSGTLGVFGSLMLIWLSVQLLSTIEKTFNQIWGVRRARNILQRIVFYWTLISLGSVLGFTSVSLGIYGRIAQQFDHLPLGHLFRESFLWLAPLWTFISVVALVAIFNRFIPNTHVRWKPAFLGALVVTILLNLSKQLSVLYVGFVIRQGSLLGVVSILPIFLFGLWLFWVILLLGGQVSFAIQNVNNLTNQRAWENVSLRTRETLSLVALLLVARRFDECRQPYSSDELADKIRVPANILNECLAQLVDIGYLSPVENESKSRQESSRYQPARPLERITLADFKQRLETRGNNEGTSLIKYSDPVLTEYEERLLDYSSSESGQKSLKQLFA